MHVNDFIMTLCITCSPIKSSRSTGTHPEFFYAFNGRFLHGLVAREPQVVVGGQVEAVLAVHIDDFAGLGEMELNFWQFELNDLGLNL